MLPLTKNYLQLKILGVQVLQKLLMKNFLNSTFTWSIFVYISSHSIIIYNIYSSILRIRNHSQSTDINSYRFKSAGFTKTLMNVFMREILRFGKISSYNHLAAVVLSLKVIFNSYTINDYSTRFTTKILSMKYLYFTFLCFSKIAVELTFRKF